MNQDKIIKKASLPHTEGNIDNSQRVRLFHSDRFFPNRLQV